MLLHVHPSNFRIIGFTEEATLPELVALSRARGLMTVDDLGSGALLDTSAFGLAHEPTPQDALAAGVSLVSFSGDKLLGGPQAGSFWARAKRGQTQASSLTRALRVDKVTLAGLQATLLHYLKGEAVKQVPIWTMLAASRADLEAAGDSVGRTTACRASRRRGDRRPVDHRRRLAPWRNHAERVRWHSPSPLPTRSPSACATTTRRSWGASKPVGWYLIPAQYWSPKSRRCSPGSSAWQK